MHTVYVLRSLKDDKLYIGRSSNLLKRLNEHNGAKVRSTKNRRPFVVAYGENYQILHDSQEGFREERSTS